MLGRLFKPSYNISGHVTKTFSYDITLINSPTVQAFKDNTVTFSCDLQAVLNIFSVFKRKLETRAYIAATINNDRDSKKLHVHLEESKLVSEPERKGNVVSKELSSLFYKAVTVAVSSQMLKQSEKIELPTNIYSFTIALPNLETKRVETEVVDITSVDLDTLAICFNFPGHVGGSRGKLVNFTEGQDVAFSISVGAIRQIMRLWWSHAEKPWVTLIEGRVDVGVDCIANFLAQLESSQDHSIEPKQLVDKELHECWVDYRLTARLQEPDFSLREGNEVGFTDLGVELDLDIDLRANMRNRIHDGVVCVESGPEIVTLASFNEGSLAAVKKASADMSIDDDYRVVARMRDLEVLLELKCDLPSEVTDLLNGVVKRHLIEIYPVLPVSPSVLEDLIPGTDLEIKFSPCKLVSDIEEVSLNGAIV